MTFRISVYYVPAHLRSITSLRPGLYIIHLVQSVLRSIRYRHNPGTRNDRQQAETSVPDTTSIRPTMIYHNIVGVAHAFRYCNVALLYQP